MKFRFFVECDGIVLNTSTLLEGPIIDTWKAWYKHRPVIAAGPFDYPIIARVPEASEENSEAILFLDSALEKHGPHSVIYVRVILTFRKKPA